MEIIAEDMYYLQNLMVIRLLFMTARMLILKIFVKKLMDGLTKLFIILEV